MRKLVVTLALLAFFSVPVIPADHDGAVFDPQRSEQCLDKAGAATDKNCVPTCGCLFHEIFEFFGEVFG